MATKIWTKRETQQTIRQLKAAGYEIQKLPAGYAVYDAEGIEVFRAMNGSRAYLVRIDSSLMQKEAA